MREPDPAAVDLDDADPGRSIQLLLGVDRGHRRRRQRRRCRQRGTHFGREAGDPIADDLAQRGGNRKRYPWLRLDLALAQQPPEFERVERISSRRLVHAPQQRTREGDTDPRAQKTVQRADRDRADRETANAFRREPIETEQRVRLVAQAPSEQERDRLVLNASKPELQERRRRLVQPLDVIDRNEHRSLARQLAESANERDGHRPRLGRCAPNVV
jgi:hypothetical protein